MDGDLDSATEALTGLQPDGGAADGAILLALGNVAYFSGDLDGARAAADEARQRLGTTADWRLLDLVALQGLIAQRGPVVPPVAARAAADPGGPGDRHRRLRRPPVRRPSTSSTDPPRTPR
jgi:hypothetical protein